MLNFLQALTVYLFGSVTNNMNVEMANLMFLDFHWSSLCIFPLLKLRSKCKSKKWGKWCIEDYLKCFKKKCISYVLVCEPRFVGKVLNQSFLDLKVALNCFILWISDKKLDHFRTCFVLGTIYFYMIKTYCVW